MTDVSAPAIDLLSGSFYSQDPYPAFAWMRREAPLYYDEANRIWGVSRYADVRAVGQDPKSFSSAGGSRPGIALPYMIDMDAPEHRRRRRLVNALFTPQAVKAREERIAIVCDRLIDSICAAGECDLVADVAVPLPLVMIADMLGFPSRDWPRLLEWSDTMLMSQGSPEPDALDRATTAFVEWDTYVRAHIEDRRRTGASDDLLGMLVCGATDAEPLDDSSLVHEALLILVGGDETTRHVISGGMQALLGHPSQVEDLRRAPGLIEGAVEEMLRWVSPIKNMNRTATRDVDLHGRTVHRGDNVLLLYPSANRDEEVFADPERFDVHREPNEHVAFGFGAHLCLGQRLARAELVTVVGRLLARLPDLALDTSKQTPMRVSNFIVGHEALPVRFTPTEPI
ncbi:MAG TPA: cytochrome P450 [Acidimicrobiales bacterium]|nr:cytochrome P450 [Acidimicrobiales bacterium]